MGLFKSTKLFCNVAPHADAVANSMMSSMRYDGYEVDGVKLPSGDWDISIKKGDLFKAVLGLQTALKIKIFNFPGKMIISELSLAHRTALKTLKKGK